VLQTWDSFCDKTRAIAYSVSLEFAWAKTVEFKNKQYVTWGALRADLRPLVIETLTTTALSLSTTAKVGDGNGEVPSATPVSSPTSSLMAASGLATPAPKAHDTAFDLLLAACSTTTSTAGARSDEATSSSSSANTTTSPTPLAAAAAPGAPAQTATAAALALVPVKKEAADDAVAHPKICLAKLFDTEVAEVPGGDCAGEGDASADHDELPVFDVANSETGSITMLGLAQLCSVIQADLFQRAEADDQRSWINNLFYDLYSKNKTSPSLYALPKLLEKLPEVPLHLAGHVTTNPGPSSYPILVRGLTTQTQCDSGSNDSKNDNSITQHRS
jgi:hypothetical protein